MGTEKEVLDLLERYGMREKTVVTSFKFECLKNVKALFPSYKVGYLAADFDSEALAEMKKVGVEQLCPQAEPKLFGFGFGRGRRIHEPTSRRWRS